MEPHEWDSSFIKETPQSSLAPVWIHAGHRVLVSLQGPGRGLGATVTIVFLLETVLFPFMMGVSMQGVALAIGTRPVTPCD